MRTILIVGGAGYIGSHMLLHLLQQDVEIIVLDNLSTGSREALLGGSLYHGDLADRELLREIFSQHAVDVVMHFAALIRVDESVAEPAKYYANNTFKTMVLLEEMLAAKVSKFIFSSTAAVYGIPDYSPVDLKHPCAPINPYGQSKLMVEQMLKDFDHAYGLKSMVFRYFNAAGADPEGRIGFHEPLTHLIPRVLKAASGRKVGIDIYGTDYDTADGTCVRDYIHVNDLVSAHALGMDALCDGAASATYNLGSGSGYSVRQVIDCVQQQLDIKLNISEKPRRAGDPAQLVADNQAAVQQLGWKLNCSDLTSIIKDAWQWETKAKWR